MPVQDLFVEPNELSEEPACKLELSRVPHTTVQIELIVTQPVDRRNAPTTMNDPFSTRTDPTCGSSKCSLVIDGIGKLLQNAEDFTHNIPSTADSLGTISRLFPLGHGPSVEAVDEQTKHEKVLIENLRGALCLMRSGFMAYAKNQDSICREYEREAVVLESQIRDQNDAAGVGDCLNETSLFPGSGLGQPKGAAEVTLFHPFFCSL
jgi:hypothetical protein